MNQLFLIWNYARFWFGRFGGRFSRDAVFKDTRDLGKILIGAGLLGFIVENSAQGRYGVALVVGVVIYLLGAWNEDDAQ